MSDSGARLAGARVGFAVTIVVLGGLALTGGHGAVSPVGSAAAATTTDVYLDPVESAIGPNGSTTYDVVVSSVRGGVGAYDLTVLSTSPSVVGITGASDAIGGESEVDLERDGSEARIAAFSGDTVDDGSNVTVARVTVAGKGQTGRSTLLVDVASLSDEAGSGYRVADTGIGTVRIRTARFRTSSLFVRPNPALLGDRIQLTVGVENTGPVAGETTVFGVFDGSVVGERTLRVAAGDTAEATFEFSPSSPGTYSVRATGPDISSSRSILEVRRVPTVAGADAAATDPDGDGAYEDVNGDGEVRPGDATVLFNAVFDRDPAVTDNAGLFDFNGDGEVTPGDATVLFEEAF
ncbi:MAG: dockerin type I domain-containing protein [Haloarculaceae archaeon]